MSNHDIHSHDSHHVPLPPNIPPWIPGVAFLVTTFLSSLVAAYLALAPTIDRYIETNKQVSLENIKSKQEMYVKENEQLHSSNAEHAKRLDELFRTVQELYKALSDCEKRKN